MAKKRGLDDWFGKENWVDISAPKEGGGYEKCGRKSAKDSDRGYPKCVPAAKAAKMSKKEVASAVRRKRAKKQGVGGKPTNVKTFAAEGGSIMKMKTKGYRKGGAPSKGAVGKSLGGSIRRTAVKKAQSQGSGGTREGNASNRATRGTMIARSNRVKQNPNTLPPFPGPGGRPPGGMKGGGMATKGYAKGGAMKSKAKSSPVRAPSSKNSGLYGR